MDKERIEQEKEEFVKVFEEEELEKEPEEEKEEEKEETKNEETEENNEDEEEEKTEDDKKEDDEDVDDGEETKDEEEDESKDEDDEEEGDDKLLQKYKSLQGMWRSEKEKREEIEQKLIEIENKINANKEEEDTKEKDEEDKRELTAKEKKWVSEVLDKNDKLKEIKEDFPEIAEAFEETLKDTITEYSVRQSQQVMELLQQNIAPLLAMQQERSAKEHFEKISEAHKDYMDYVENGELENWIKAQPKRKQKYLFEVYNEGSAEEVIELYDEFKEDKGITKEEPKKKKKKVRTQKDTRKLEDMHEPGERQRPVGTASSKADKDDFEGAFDEAIKEVEKK